MPDGPIKRAFKGATAGAFVSTAAEVLGDAGDIEFTFAAQAYTKAILGQFAEKSGYFDLAD